MFEPLSKIPSGMRYYFGAEARARRAVEDACMSVFDGWSYEEIATPSVDYYALFEHGMGHDEAHRAFRFTDTDGRMLALRPDVTSSVARRRDPFRGTRAASAFVLCGSRLSATLAVARRVAAREPADRV